LTILETEARIHSGYRVYPVPEKVVDGDSDAAVVSEVFAYDEAAYRQDSYYPQTTAELGASYLYRGGLKQQVIFYPLHFNPVSGKIELLTRIRVRLDYVDAGVSLVETSEPIAWAPPKPASGPAPPAVAAIIGVPMPAGWLPPLVPPLFPLNILLGAVWTPNPEQADISAYKLELDGEGIYRITRAQLAAQGFEAGEIDALDLSRVRLYYLGEELAVYIHDQDADDTLDADDYIEFYGRAVSCQYSKYTRKNVYWMVSDGSGIPLRVETIDGTGASGSNPGTHRYTVRLEEDQTYLLNSPGSDSLDRWIFSAVARGDEINHAQAGLPVNFTLTTPFVGGGNQGSLTIRMFGKYDILHQASIVVNGTDYGIHTWFGTGFSEAIIEAVDLIEGDNLVSVTCNSGEDKIQFDSLEMTYDRQLAAENDMLTFTHEGGYRYQLTGFRSTDLILYDITDPNRILRVANHDVFGPDPYTIDFEDPPGETKTYVAMTSDRAETQMTIIEDVASSLADPGNGADYILITHRSLGWDNDGQQQPWLQDLTEKREDQGMRVAVVDVQDIYDEFSYGVMTPEGIKDFLTYAYNNWPAPAPQFVVLVGDSSYDFKDNWGVGTTIQVPAYLIYTSDLGETATDDWFVQISGEDAVPDMYIGRLPAKTVAEAEIMVAKIIAHEQALTTKKDWWRNTALVADNQIEVWEAVFEEMNEDAADLLPDGMNMPDRFYLQEYDDELLAVSDLTTDLVNQINAGALIVNYSGHGSFTNWATERIIDNRGPLYREDVEEQLANAGKYPLVVSMSCLNGYFLYPEAWTTMYNYNYHSLGEALMRADEKGAAAVLVPTGMTTTLGQHILNSALFEQIFSEDNRTLGPAIATAKQNLLANGDSSFEEISKTFLLFGDPAMNLKVPMPRRPVNLEVFRQNDNSILLRWSAALDSNDNEVDGYHVYRRAGISGAWIKLTASPLQALEYQDSPGPIGSAALGGDSATYYYAVTSVDEFGDESVMSTAVSPPAMALSLGGNAGGGSGGGGCFVSAAQFDPFPYSAQIGVTLGCLIGFFILIMRRRRQ
jgi:hypothetical protein